MNDLYFWETRNRFWQVGHVVTPSNVSVVMILGTVDFDFAVNDDTLAN
jgi:hypothetical protein